MSFHTDMKLASISIEIHALKDGFELIKSTLDKLKASEKEKLEKTLRSEQFLDEDKIIDFHQDLLDKVDIFYPRLFWGPYLITIFSVFESCTQELTEYIRENKKCKLKLADLKGSLLEKLKKYYSSVLEEPCFKNKTSWQTITDLSKIRNAFAHDNGRLIKLEGKIYEFTHQTKGVSENLGLLIVTPDFVRKCLDSVIEVIEELKTLYIYQYDLNSSNDKSK